MNRIYIAGLYSKNEKGEKAHIIEVLKNMREGIKISLEILRNGYSPFCPWLDYQFFLADDLEITETQIKKYSLDWLEVCDAIIVISGKDVSGGVKAEINRAAELNIPVFYGTTEFYDNQKIQALGGDMCEEPKTIRVRIHKKLSKYKNELGTIIASTANGLFRVRVHVEGLPEILCEPIEVEPC